MFAESQLPQKWGWVLSYNMGQNKTDLMQDNPSDVQIQSMNFPSGAAKPVPHRRPSNLSLTAAVAIAVAGLIVLLGLVCAVFAYRRRHAKRQAKVAKATKTGKDNNGHGVVGGTHSGYLADLDGMDDGMSEKMTKRSFGRVSDALVLSPVRWSAVLNAVCAVRLSALMQQLGINHPVAALGSHVGW